MIVVKKDVLDEMLEKIFASRILVCIKVKSHDTKIFVIITAPLLLYSRTPFQVKLCLASVLAVESLQFLIKSSITLINVVDIGVVIVHSASTVFLSLCNPVNRR